MTTINIKNLNKVELLEKLWENQIIAGFFTFNAVAAPQFDKKQAENAVTDHIDYFCGRAIKTDISKDEVVTYLYDRDAGQGKFESIVRAMRSADTVKKN
jgi:hypothetical protein